MWNYVYRVADGTLVSETSDDGIVSKVPAGCAVRQKATRIDASANVWDTVLKDWKPAPVDAMTTLRTTLQAKPSNTWTLADVADWLKARG